jgi:hypothetical protein
MHRLSEGDSGRTVERGQAGQNRHVRLSRAASRLTGANCWFLGANDQGPANPTALFTSALPHVLVIRPHQRGRLNFVLKGPNKKAVRAAFVLQMLHKPPGDCSTRRLRSDRHDLVGAVHALAAVLAALVAVGTARADDLSEAEREFCRDSADMASSVSRDLVTAPTTMAEYQSYRDALLKLLTHEIEMLRSRHCPQAEEAADQAAATMIRIAITAKSVRGN